MSRTARHSRKPAREQRRDEPASAAAAALDARSHLTWRWGLFAAALPLALLALRLNQDLWYDEVYTLLFFVSQGCERIVTDYHAPNNHVLFSLLLRPFYLLSDSEFVLRLPSFLCAAGTLAATFRLAHQKSGLPAGCLAALLLGTNVFYQTHAVQVRGYSLAMLLGTILAGDVLAGGPNLSTGVRGFRVGRIALLGAAFLYVMPSNLLFFAPWAGAAVLSHGRRHGWQAAGREALRWAAAGLLAALLYLPIVDQVLQLQQGSSRPTLGAALRLAGGVLWAAGRDAWPLALVSAWGGWLLLRRRQPGRGLLALALTTVSAALALVYVLGQSPFVRNFLPLLPLLAAAIGCALAETAARLLGAGRFQSLPQRVAWLGGALILLVQLPPLATYPARLEVARSASLVQDGYFNYYSARYHPRALAQFLAAESPAHGPVRLAYADLDYFVLEYYCQREGVVRPEAASSTATPVALIRTPYVAPADWDQMAARSGWPVAALQAAPLVKDFGYFRLHRPATALARPEH